MIKVVCGIIYKNRQILICRKKPDKSLGGYWEFPGGKIEAGETAPEALYRELKEELGMSASIGKRYTTVFHSYETCTIELTAYICQFEEASFRLTDHDCYKWIDANDLNMYNLAPADIAIAEKLRHSTR